MALGLSGAHLSAQQAASASSSGQGTVQPQASSSSSQPIATATADLSQPGARGQLHPAIVPPVPVPPGPVAPKGIKPAPPTPIAVKKVELQGNDPWNPEWDVVIEENLPPELLSRKVERDVKPFCPRFNLLTDADKRAFWAYFFQALAGAEAGLKPTSDVRHTEPAVAIIDPVTHHVTRQQGLLQLQYEDGVRYGCNFDWNLDKNLPVGDPGKTILDPKNNLLCGIHILQNQLVNLHEPLLTHKSYWATLRPGTISYEVFARQMANVPEACGQRVVQQPRHRRFEQTLQEALFRGQDSGEQTTEASSFQSQQ